MRQSEVKRSTRETTILVRLNLEGTGKHVIKTGLGFLDHMLSHVAVHGVFDLEIQMEGDLEIDAHHSVEDAALTLGEAFDKALEDRAGIVRIGSAYVPMDDALARVAIDLSGRPHCVFQAGWHTPLIGTLPTSLISHFFSSFANTAKANIHANVLYNLDDHHGAEALFKAFGRSLDQATRIDPRRSGMIPSTKGMV
jgi:imidazoleglycerol-phosphate dehydratase